MMALPTIRTAAGPECLTEARAIQAPVGFEDFMTAADGGTR